MYLPVFDKVQAQGRHLAVTAWHCLHSLTAADATSAVSLAGDATHIFVADTRVYNLHQGVF